MAPNVRYTRMEESDELPQMERDWRLFPYVHNAVCTTPEVLGLSASGDFPHGLRCGRPSLYWGIFASRRHLPDVTTDPLRGSQVG